MGEVASPKRRLENKNRIARALTRQRTKGSNGRVLVLAQKKQK